MPRRNNLSLLITLLITLLTLVLLSALPATAQEHQMDQIKLGLDLITKDPVVILNGSHSGRSLAITIGPFEATAISIALEGSKFPRPLTHDLMKSIIEALHAKVDRVIIQDVKADTFYAKVVLVQSDGSRMEIDARPSDAIALALRTKSPIFVTEYVLEHLPAKPSTPSPPSKKEGPTPQSRTRNSPALTSAEKKATELVREGDLLAAQAFTSRDGAFEPYKENGAESYRKAIPKYNAAIAICPNLGQAYAARGAAHYFLKETQAAQKDARTALRLGHLRDSDLTLLHASFSGKESREICRQCMKMAGPANPLYDHLWRDLAQTYWYEGNFESYVSELEAILAWQKRYHRDFTEITLNSLGSGYEVLGNFNRAEDVYKETGESDSLVRLYIHQERWTEARAALERYAAKFEPDEKTVFSAGIDELDGKLVKVSSEQMAAAQRLGNDGSYYAFYLGLLQLRAGQGQQGRDTLRAFCEMCDSNPTEWGVTLAWECRRARQILQSH